MLLLGLNRITLSLLGCFLLFSSISRAEPFFYYYTFLSGGAGTGSLILNASQTGASVVVSGSLNGSDPAPDSIAAEFGTLFNLIPGGTDFFYSGTVFALGCCGGVSVGQVFGNWIQDLEAGSGGGVSGIDYSLNEPPPPDIFIPEPSSVALLATGAAFLAIRRFRSKGARG